jgi:uncharacterized membrane protein YdjX (TVP38/TMEM64 family)
VTRHVTRRWLLIAVLLLALVLVPFFLFGDVLAQLAEWLLATRLPWWIAAPVIALLLASDLFLPIPSSAVSTAAGVLFGFAGGTTVSAIGMTAGALAAHWISASIGRAGVIRLVGTRELARGEALVRTYGAAALVIARPVPVLAEASVFAAAALGIPIGRFSVVVGLSNVGLSAAYAAIGASSASRGSFLLAFAGAVVLPGLALLTWLLVQRGTRRRTVG